jgi:hypothetical protein
LRTQSGAGPSGFAVFSESLSSDFHREAQWLQYLLQKEKLEMSLLNHTYNYIVSYDLNGPTPSHAEMDAHIQKFSVWYGRILETVWYVQSSASLQEVYDYMNAILSANDRIIVIEAEDAWMRNLLVDIPSLQRAWALAA